MDLHGWWRYRITYATAPIAFLGKAIFWVTRSSLHSSTLTCKAIMLCLSLALSSRLVVKGFLSKGAVVNSTLSWGANWVASDGVSDCWPYQMHNFWHPSKHQPLQGLVSMLPGMPLPWWSIKTFLGGLITFMLPSKKSEESLTTQIYMTKIYQNFYRIFYHVATQYFLPPHIERLTKV